MRKKSPVVTTKITGKQIQKYLKRMNISRSALARALNVNPSSITRWVEPDSKYPQSPTSTTLLVLIPLLLSEEIEVLPRPSTSDVEHYAKKLLRLGLLSEADLKKRKTWEAIGKIITVEQSEELAASRRLFEMLAAAWEKIQRTQKLK